MIFVCIIKSTFKANLPRRCFFMRKCAERKGESVLLVYLSLNLLDGEFVSLQ